MGSYSYFLKEVWKKGGKIDRNGTGGKEQKRVTSE